jgi:hypothetical protein
VAGFRWEVGDCSSTKYAQRFYEQLLETRSVDKAFLNARRESHDKHFRDRTWASAMLVMARR